MPDPQLPELVIPKAVEVLRQNEAEVWSHGDLINFFFEREFIEGDLTSVYLHFKENPAGAESQDSGLPNKKFLNLILTFKVQKVVLLGLEVVPEVAVGGPLLLPVLGLVGPREVHRLVLEEANPALLLHQIILFLVNHFKSNLFNSWPGGLQPSWEPGCSSQLIKIN